jgi:co-chaperonin GroES (HSP10)
METFPRRPFPRRPIKDRVIVREIPLNEIYQQSDIAIPLDDERVKDRSDRGVVVAVGYGVCEVKIGETVFFDEFALCDPVFLNPADKRRADLPKYWQIREDDLKGVLVCESQQPVEGCGKTWGGIGNEIMRCIREKGHSGACVALHPDPYFFDEHKSAYA